jgi:hypothetical protein
MTTDNNSWQHIQRDFSGGEIHGRMLMRADTDVYKKSVIEMVNFMPMPQGPAKRAPGTSFLLDPETNNIRIIPYLTPGNERSLVMITDSIVKIITNVTEFIDTDVTLADLDLGAGTGGTISYRTQALQNPTFSEGMSGWLPPYVQQYWPDGTPVYNSAIVGEGTNDAYRKLTAYNFGVAPTTQSLADLQRPYIGQYVGVNVATDTVTINYDLAIEPDPQFPGPYEISVIVREGVDFNAGQILYEEYYNQDTNSLGTTINKTASVSLPSAGWTGEINIKVQVEAKISYESPRSSVTVRVNYVKLFINAESELNVTDLTSPYDAEDLQDLHYVQSPYDDKELVITHPKYPPHKLYFNTSGGTYAFEPITFTNPPGAWGINNYPAACTSYLGRLVLAGGQSFEVPPGDPLATTAETIWMTESGNWDAFTASAADPDDSIEITSIYRSPIQWAFGQRSLLVGAIEYEYSVLGQVILTPGDVGVYLQSTHGGTNVQPAAMGASVMFAADAGTKLRRLTYVRENDGWIAEDLTIFNPVICQPRIRRLARMRNPHQICVALLDSGRMSWYHEDQGVRGWNKYRMDGAKIQDICVVRDRRGTDVLFMTVQRSIGGVTKTYIECIPNFTEINEWRYLNSSKAFTFSEPTSQITGLEHLEGQIVQAIQGPRYFGFYTVENGKIDLKSGGETGGFEAFTTYIEVGLAAPGYLKTLPPEKLDPGASSRYVDFAVRTLGSSRPIINGERPDDRDPSTILNVSQPIDLLNDVKIMKFGFDAYQVIEISEHLPLRCEILGVYGKVKQGNVP